MEKAIIALTLALLLMPNIAVASPTLVKELFQKTYTFDLTTISYKSCKVQDNYESGDCDYLYACYVIVPKGTTELYQVYQKECQEVTGQAKAEITVSIVPPRGKIYAVTPFIAKVHYLYNTSTYTWYVADTTMPLKLAEEIITLCDENKVLRNNLCYNWIGVCANTMDSNMCTNAYDAYCLDYDCNNNTECMLSKCNSNPMYLCTDRDHDKVCDDVISGTCSDVQKCSGFKGNLSMGSNGICDDTDLLFCGNQCKDANTNGICDDVETAGCFCQYTYQPVCWTSKTQQTCSLSEQCPTGQLCIDGYCSYAVTYPNECFAKCAGKFGYTSGECIPKVEKIQCRANTDCYKPCDGITTTCINYMCSYAGECNPRYRQCFVDSDCPSSPCKGVTVSCSSSNTCVFTGKCITPPTPPPSIWDLILQKFYELIQWIKGLLGWA